MKFMLSMVFTIALSAQAEAATKMTLDGAMHNVANQVKEAIKENILIKGKKLAIGNFDGDGAKARKSNFSVGIKQKLTELLKDVQDEESDVTLTGNYVFTNGSGDNTGIDVVLMVVSIKELGKLVHEIKDIEINDTNSLDLTLGTTNAPPQHGDLKERNDSVKKAVEKPEFELVDGHLVAAKGNPKLCLGIQKKKTFNGAASAVVPENVKGLAFASIGVGEYYELEIANKDTVDVVAKITIDGLDVATTFTSDLGPDGKKAKYPGFLIRKGSSGVIKGWLNTVDQSKKDNVFTFVVNQLGQGAATQLNTRGSVGVITVQFREAAPPNGTFSRSVGGETGKGEPLDQKFTTESMQISENVLSTVSIRYNRPQ